MIKGCLLLLILRLVLIAYASTCSASIPPIRKIISLAFAATSSPRSKADLPPLPLLTKDRRHLKETHGFSDEANWLIPGIVLVGRYPGSDPYLPCTPKEQTDRIHDLVHRGKVTTFLCLQSELPSQEDAESWDGEIAIHSWAHGFRWYADDVNKAVAASLEEKDGGRKPSFIHFPVADMDVIEPLSRLHFLILTLEKVILTRNENVYIHCWGGCGRSGIVSACLLGAFYPGLKAEQAINHVNSYFHLRSAEALMPHRRSPETDRQVAQAKAYFKTYLGR